MRLTLLPIIAALVAMGGTAPLTVIANNDGTAERLKVGQRVGFAGLLWVEFEGIWIGNYIAEPPEPGGKAGPDFNKDFVCADLLVPVTENKRLLRLVGKPVIAIGTVSRVGKKAGRCPISLAQVTVRLR